MMRQSEQAAVTELWGMSPVVKYVYVAPLATGSETKHEYNSHKAVFNPGLVSQVLAAKNFNVSQRSQ